MAEELTFRLEDFEGPLELLLTLVQKHKMDLHNIPILELIDQYTRAVESAESTDPEISSAFIEMAAHLVEMKSYLLLPRSEEGERMKQELTGQLIEYDQCRRMAARLRERGEEYTVFVRTPARLKWDNTYDLFHSPQVLADCWQALMGRTTVRKMPTQQQFEPLVSAPQVSVSSRVVYILRQLIAGGAKKMDQLFSRRQTRGANVATFLALLELVRGGRVTLGPEGELKMHKGGAMNQKQIRAAVEAMLFAYAEPIGADKLAQALQLPTASVESALEALHERCQKEDSGLCLLHLNTHWQLATKTEFAECIRRVLDTRRSIPLGPAAMETLTVIAYNQPVSRAFIEQVRGVDSSSSVSGLLEKGLIEEAGRLDLPGRPVAFRTTDVFLRCFGLSSLEDLPPVRGTESEAAQ